MNIENIIKELNSLKEEDYKKFNKKLIPTKQEILGVRLPVLRDMAKEIAKDDFKTFLALPKNNLYELIMLEGLVLTYNKKNFMEQIEDIENYILKVDNWAQIDSPFLSFKLIKKEKKEVLEQIKKWIFSKDEFKVRTALVILLGFYVEDEYLDIIFEISQEVQHKAYYVYMANAWLISVCMAKFPLETIEFFKTNTLENKTHNQAIQKSRESLRVSKEHKEFINSLKRK